MAGAIAVLGMGAVVYNDNENNINRLNDDNAKLAARISSLEATPGYSLPSSITSGIAANCAALQAIDGIATDGDANAEAVLVLIRAAVDVTC